MGAPVELSKDAVVTVRMGGGEERSSVWGGWAGRWIEEEEEAHLLGPPLKRGEWVLGRDLVHSHFHAFFRR